MSAVCHRVELKPVVDFKGARRVEAKPSAPFAVLRDALHDSDWRAEVTKRLRVDWRFLALAVEVELRRAARENCLEVSERHTLAAARIEYLPIELRDSRNIERRFHAALDLERDDASVNELPDILAKPQILHGEDVRVDRLAISHAAAVGAFAAVAASALLHRAKETKP